MAHRARLAVCITAFEYGGQGTVVDQELRWLRNQFELTLLAEKIDRPVPSGVAFVQIPTWSVFPITNPRLRDLLSTFDIVHCHDSLGFMLGAALSHSRYIVTCHGIAPLRFRETLRSKLKGAATLVAYPALYRSARLVIGISKYITEWLRGFARVDAVTIGNGAPEVEEYDYDIPARRDLLYVGAISRRKGIDELVSSLSSAPPDVRLELVGRGDPKPFLRTAVRSGVAARVRFHGELTETELREIYRASFCTCSASYWEGFGLPILEGFSAGRPAIARPTGGMLELLETSQAGCSVSDFAGLDTCVRFITDNWHDLSQRGLRFARAHSWANTFTEYGDLFRRQLGT